MGIHTRESSLCSIIRVQQKPLPNRTVLFSKVLLHRISSSLWPLVLQENKLGEGRQVKFRRPKLQVTGFFWRICTYVWFGLKAIIPGGNKEISLLFVFFGLYDLLDPRNSLSFVSCERTYNSQVLRARIEEVLPHVRCKREGGLVLPVMSSNSFNICHYSTRKGFSQTRGKVVDLKRKKLGEVPAQSCC